MKFKVENKFGHVTHCFHTLAELRDFDIEAYESGCMLVLNYITENTIYFLIKERPIDEEV